MAGPAPARFYLDNQATKQPRFPENFVSWFPGCVILQQCSGEWCQALARLPDAGPAEFHAAFSCSIVVFNAELRGENRTLPVFAISAPPRLVLIVFDFIASILPIMFLRRVSRNATVTSPCQSAFP